MLPHCFYVNQLSGVFVVRWCHRCIWCLSQEYRFEALQIWIISIITRCHIAVCHSEEVLSQTHIYIHVVIGECISTLKLTLIWHSELTVHFYYKLNEMSKLFKKNLRSDMKTYSDVTNLIFHLICLFLEIQNASDINSLQQLFLKAQRWQLTTTNYNVTKLFENCDVALFKSSINVNHCLRHLYSEKWQHVHSMTLRTRGHNFMLPKCRLQSTRNSFINRVLFSFL